MAVLAKYGLSITSLIGTAAPDMVDALARGPQHGAIGAGLYPSGGLEKAVGRIAAFDALRRRLIYREMPK